MPAFKFQGKIILIIFKFIRTLLTFEQKVEDKRMRHVEEAAFWDLSQYFILTLVSSSLGIKLRPNISVSLL